jgi:hypothetical protein
MAGVPGGGPVPRTRGSKGELIDRAIGTLASASTAAAETLRDLLDAESESVRLGTCRAILEPQAKLRETEELTGRVEALEEALVDRQASRWAG